MGEIAREMICYNCTRKNMEENIISEGIDENGVHYFVTKPNETYILDENYFPSDNFLRKGLIEISNYYIPRMGKYELESFVAKELMTAIFVTRSLDRIFNISIMITTFGGSCYISKENLKELLLPLFQIRKDNHVYKCRFKEEIFK
ncbi:MAG: hypothetical protein Q4D02_07290 [Clostridia bacterium]|nr:hypothetical protein [Clostridia bacterium]